MSDVDNSITILSEGFSAIEFVTNPYALSAFTLLVILIALGVFVENHKTRTALLSVFGLIAIAIPVLQLYAVRTEVLDHTLLHVVRDATPVRLGKNVKVSLVDIETLKGKKNWEFNSKLLNARDIYDRVMVSSGLTPNSYPSFDTVDDEKWRDFIKKLEESSEIGTKLKAEKIKDIPFARLRVLVGGVERTDITDSWHFKGDKVDLEELEFEVVNIYNTKHHSSGEREAVNVRIVK